ncbi:MAG TPA: WGxxGxxG family protein [Acidimicrobiia bacterium]|nr:WGxxGxxG family protein [Acidimicrobiia bacterium]
MRKKLLTVGLAAMLSMGIGTAALADSGASVVAQDVTTTTPDVTTQQETGDDNGNAGLWGLLGLLGLGGLAGLRRDDRDNRRDLTRDHQRDLTSDHQLKG